MTHAHTNRRTESTADEGAAIKADASAYLAELILVREELLPDADDAETLSELTMVESQIRSAKQELAGS
jgi:hypothetical protein